MTLRRFVIFLVFAAAVVAAATIGWQFAEQSKPVSGPIILVSIDTLRADRLPVYGYANARTPNLDALARSSIVFDRAYAHSPQTLPSHASLLTGRLPFDHGVRDNLGFALGEDVPTLAELLRSRGFGTGAAVSAYVLREETGIGRGFTTYDAKLPAAAADAAIASVQREGSDTLDSAIEWLNGQGGTRFFYFLHLYEPHKPYAPPPRFTAAHPYDGEIEYADELVGRLVATLKADGVYEDALIIVTSDHGEGLGDHGEQEHGLFLYDEAVRVPLLVKMPGAAADPDGVLRRVGAPVQHIDLVPTILDLVRAPFPDGLRGRSLRGVLEDEEATLQEQGIYAEALYGRFHFGWAELYSLTDERFRYIRAPRPELYDLAADPEERANLADGRQSTALAMAGALDGLMSGARIEGPAEVSAEDREKFAALGYVGIQPTRPAGDDAALADPKDMIPVLEAYRRGVDLAGERKFAEAIGVLAGIVRERPEMVDVWNQLGNLQMRAGHVEDAVASFRRFVELRPDNPAGPLAVAAAQFRLGKLDDAAKHAALAADIAPESDTRNRLAAYELGARIALARKLPDEALALAELGAKADPAVPLVAFVEGRTLYEKEDFAGALEKFEAVVKAGTGRTIQIHEARWYLGDTLARLERYPEAEKAFQDELRLSPLSGRAYSSLVMLYAASNRPELAAQTIESLLRVMPTPEGQALAARLKRIVGIR